MSYSLETLTAFSEALDIFNEVDSPSAALQAALPILGLLLGTRQMLVVKVPDAETPAQPRQHAARPIRIDSSAARVVPRRFAPALHRGPSVLTPNREPPVFFCEILRSLKSRNQLCLVVRLPHATLGVTFHRRKPFTEDEHYLLSLLQTHLADAVQSKDSLPAAQAAHGWQLRVRSDGTSEPVDDELAQLLARYFPSTAGSRALPRELVGWVRRQLTHPGRAEPPAVSGPEWIIAQPGGRLLLRLANSGPYRVLHVREERGAADFFRLKGRGLTPRECEVAFWVGQGRRDAEIARLLGCAVKTASKHMENLLAKTGAETRAGATHAVQEWLRAPA